jgi:hypothetical protein
MFERNNCCRFPAQDPLAQGDCQIGSGRGKIDPSRTLGGDDADTLVAGHDGRVVPRDSPGVDGSLHDIECAVYGSDMAHSSSADLDNTNDRSRTETGNLLPDKLDE